MSVLSFSVQCAGDQSPTSKGILEDCPRQKEEDKLSLGILDKKHILFAADQPQHELKSHAEDDALEIHGYTSVRHMDEVPDSKQAAAERQLLYGECSQSKNNFKQNDEILCADPSLMEDCSTLDDASDANASFPREKCCKVEDGPFIIPYLRCDGSIHCHEQKGVELMHGLCNANGGAPSEKDSCSNVISEDRKGETSNVDTSILIETQDSHPEAKVQLGTPNQPMDHALQTELQQQNNELLSASVNSVQTTRKIGSQGQDRYQEGESGLLGADYTEDQTVALWVKWRGKWQTGFQCPRVDCPLQTLRAKPTHERKKYLAIFFPRTRRYSWADLLLIRSINEFPEPLMSGTHRKWKKLVKDLTTPRRFVMQKLAVAMLNISDQLHTEAVIEVARNATTWKEFAMEASHCRDYPDLGKMLLKLQTMILPTYVSSAWIETLFGSWKQRCENAHSAESIEILTKELMASVQWSRVEDLWNAPVQPELGAEWKTWKLEAMRWFTTSHPIANNTDVIQRNCDASVSMEPQNSSKRPKLEIRRAESCASQIEASDCRIVSQDFKVDTDSGHSICQGIIGRTPRCEPPKVEEHPVVAPLNSSTAINGGWNEIHGKSGSVMLIENPAQLFIDGRNGNATRATTPYQYRQCAAFMAAKGRQCGRWASDGDVYCCVHTNASSGGKSLQDQRPPPDAPMCEGVTTHGHKCKHRARLGSAFCKKHRLQISHDSVEVNGLPVNDVSTFSKDRLKRKFADDNALEKFSSSNASNSEELGLREYETSIQENLIPVMIGETLGERNCLMKKSELYNALPAPVRDASPEISSCIGYYGQVNSEQCLQTAKRHTLYCEKHIPKFLKRARNGKTRLVSKDAFVNLLKNCSCRKQKLYLHQACELLYAFMKRSLTRQKPILNDNLMDWTLSEVSKDLNVGEYLLKLVSFEREKIMRLWGFGADKAKEAISPGTNGLSKLEVREKDSDMTVKCKICGAEFFDDQMLGAHWTDSHKKEVRWLFRGYACAVCMSSFTNRKVLESHVKERHGPQFLEHSILFRCMSCNSHFVNSEQLRQHVLSFHLTEFRLTDHGQHNYHSMDQLQESKIESVKEDGSQRYVCRFCGLKFDLLPDLGRHHQVAHKNQSSVNHFRGNHYIKHNRQGHSRFKKSFGAAYRFKNQASFGVQKRFPSSNLALSLRPKLKSETSEAVALGRLLESHCADVAETLFSEMQKAKSRPSNMEILSVARSACCRISLHGALEAKYGAMPVNLYLKAAKLCSEQNIQIGWHVEGFICPKGCKPLMSVPPLKFLKSIQKGDVDPPESHPDFTIDSDNKWEMEECHYILDSKHFNQKAMHKAIVLCEDVSFGKEPVPVACVIDEVLKDVLDISYHGISYSEGPPALMPWQSFTYITRRLIEPSIGIDTENSHLGCACPPFKCCPEKCDHVYLFDNDYENAEDIHGKSMRGRFPYDEKGRIVLEQGYLVYECNSLCKCDATCANRVLQKGIQVKLEIFKTEKKGWAVRAGEAISRGTFVCEYIGEVMNDAEGNKRDGRFHNSGCAYLYDINAHVGRKGLIEGTLPYVVNATKFGNVSRFINHSCSPNLVNYLVLVESMDCQLAHIGLYASRDIARGEELAYDYCYELLPEGGCPCYCGAPNCRGRLY